jgi:hypothetical protein
MCHFWQNEYGRYTPFCFFKYKNALNLSEKKWFFDGGVWAQLKRFSTQKVVGE